MRRNNIILYSIETLLVVILMALFLLALNSDISNTINSLAADRLEEVSRQTSFSIDYIIREAKSDIEYLAKKVSDYKPDVIIEEENGIDYVSGINDDYKQIMQILEEHSNTTSFSKLRYVLITDDNKSGWTIRSDAYTSFPNEQAICIKNLDWFLDVSEGNSGISDVLDSTIEDNKSFFTVYYPVIDDSGKIIGAVNGLIYTNDFNDLIEFDSFDGSGYSHIIQKSGEVVYISSNSHVSGSGTNFFNLDLKTSSLKISEIKEKMNNDESFFLEVSKYKKLIYFSKTGINDWYTVTIVDSNIFNTHSMKISSMMSIFTVEISLLFIVIGSLTIIKINNVNKRKIESIKESRKSNEKSDLILSSSNLGYFEYDYLNKTLEIFKTINNSSKYIPGVKYKIFDSDSLDDINSEYRMDFLNLFNEKLEKTKKALILTNNNRWLNFTIKNVSNDNNYIGIVQDVTEEKNHEQELIIQASNDQLTKILNRSGFINKFESTNKRRYALAIIDIDEFKSINDTYGHQRGDEALISFSRILEESINQESFACRLGGDEFMIYLNESDLNNIDNINNKIKSSIKLNISIPIFYSMGVIISDSKCSDFKTLYKLADEALYEAKRKGKNKYIINKFK